MTTITQVITTLPTAPDPSQPETFNTLASAFVIAQKAEVPELNTWAGQVNTVVGEVNANAATATTQAGIATTQAGIATTQAGLATTQVGLATTQANNAAASAASAAAIAGAFVGTSVTSWTPALGAQTFATQTGEQYTAGTFLSVVSVGAPSAWGVGQVTSYAGASLVMDMQVINGSGAHTDWNISLTGTRGATGATGVGVTTDAVGWHATGGTTPKTLTVTADVSLGEQPPSQGLTYFLMGLI